MGIKDFVAREKALDFVVQIYDYTRKLPAEEKHILLPQIRRAAISIPLNLSEGYGRSSKTEFARFAEIALGSAREVQTQLEICQRLGYPNPIAELESANEIIRIIFALSRSLRQKEN